MNLTIKELSQKLANKELSSKELSQEFLGRIKKFDKQIGSFLTISEDVALEQAKKADERREKGEVLGVLDGIPMAHKDLFCTKGIRTTAASKMLENFIPPHTATIAENLENAGAVMLGKLSMDEFAMGSTNENSAFGVVKNPWDLERIPGGSSGGSAAAVAARLVPYATGSDTGGSIRQPASYCGITGIKPTYGRCSRWGMIAYASSLDQAGVLGLSAEDCALVLSQMVSFDPKDSTSHPQAKEDFSLNLNNSLEGKVIGLPKVYFEGLDNQIAQKIQETAQVFEGLGAKIKEIDLKHNDTAIAAYYLIASAEASSNLARYDGVRYGYRAKEVNNLLELYEKSRREGFGKEVKRRILIGTYALSAGYYDAYYEQARRARRAILNSFKEAFNNCDVILAPTTTSTAYKIGEKIADPKAMYLGDLYTVSSNLAGLPALNFPVGFINNLPIGAQLIAPHFGESLILNFAHKYQQLNDLHKKMPELFV